MTTAELYKKFKKGDGLDDNELKSLYTFIRTTVDCLEALGDERFSLVTYELFKDREILLRYITERRQIR